MPPKPWWKFWAVPPRLSDWLWIIGVIVFVGTTVLFAAIIAFRLLCAPFAR